MGHAKYVGRVGALAVALGIGTAVITTPGIAWADDTTSNTGANSAKDSPAGTTSGAGQEQHAPETHAASTDPEPSTTGGATPGSNTAGSNGSAGQPGTSIGMAGGPDVTLNAQTTTSTETTKTAPSPTPTVISTPAATVESTPTPSPTTDPAGVTAAAPTSTDPTPVVTIAATTARASGSTKTTATAVTDPTGTPGVGSGSVQSGGATSSADGPVPATGPVTSRFARSLTVSNVVAAVPDPTEPYALPAPTVSTPPADPIAALVALPANVLSFAANLISAALAPFATGTPGVPADTPVLWAVLAFVRRQFFNSSPTLAPSAVVADPGTGQTYGSLGATDADGDALTYEVLRGPAHGAIALDDTGGYVYTPDAGYVGADGFTVAVTDVGPHVHGLNGLLSPAGPGATVATVGLTAIAIAPATSTARTLTFAALAAPAPTSPVAPRFTTASTVLPTIVLGPIKIYLNQAPTAAPQITKVDPVTGVVTGKLNAKDPNFDPLTYTVSTAPAQGTLAVSAVGTFTYTPTAAARDQALATPGFDYDQFAIKVSDGRGGTTIVTAKNVPVTPTNRAPVASSPPTVGTPDPTTGKVTGNLNVTDPDGNPLTYTVTTPPTKGTVTISANGTYTYTPNPQARLDAYDNASGATSGTPAPLARLAAFAAAVAAPNTDGFTATADDGHGGTTSVTVAGIPVAPAEAVVTATVKVGSGPQGIAVTPDGTRLYVDNDFDSTVSVIDTATNTVVKTITGIYAPRGIAVSPDGTRAYITTTGGQLAVVNTATNTVVKTLSVNSFAQGVAVSPDGKQVYVTAPNQNETRVTVVDTATNTIAGTINVGAPTSDVVFTPDGKRAYISGTAAGNDNVTVVDTATRTVITKIAVGAGQQNLTITPAGTRVYVARGYGMAVIDTATNGVITDLGGDVSGAYDVALNPSGSRAYVTNNGSTVYVVDTATNKVVSTVTAGRATYNVAVAPDGAHAYVTNLNDGTISVLTLATNRAPTAAPTVTTPDFVSGAVTVALHATDPDGDALTYAVSSGPARGTVTPTGAGNFTYTPNDTARIQAEGTPGPDADAFTVSVSDSRGATTLVPITVAVAPALIVNHTLALPGQYQWSTVSPDKSRVTFSTYDTDPNTGAVTTRVAVIDVATATQIGHTIVIPGGNMYATPTVTPDGRRAVFTTTATPVVGANPTTLVTVIDTATGAQVGNAVTVAGTAGITQALNIDASRVVVTATTTSGTPISSVTIIDTTNSTKVGDSVLVGGLVSRDTTNGLGIDVGDARTGVAVSPDGRRVVITSNDDTGLSATNPVTSRLIVVDATTGKQIGATVTLRGTAAAALTPDGTRAVVTAQHYYNQGGTLLNDASQFAVVDTATGAQLGHTVDVDGIAVAKLTDDGTRVVAVSMKYPNSAFRVGVYDTTTSNRVGTTFTSGGYATTGTAAVYGNRVVITDPGPAGTQGITVIDTTTGSQVGTTIQTSGTTYLYGIRRVDDQNHLLDIRYTNNASGVTGTTYVSVINLATGTLIAQTAVDGQLADSTINGNRAIIATKSAEPTNPSATTRIAVFDTGTGAQVGTTILVSGARGYGAPKAITLTPDGKRAWILADMTSSSSSSVVLVDLSTGAHLGATATVPGDDVYCNGRVFSPDGSRMTLVTNVNGANRVSVFDTATGALVGAPISVTGDFYTNATFRADGRRVIVSVQTPNATGDVDTTDTVIDTGTGTVIGSPFAFPGTDAYSTDGVPPGANAIEIGYFYDGGDRTSVTLVNTTGGTQLGQTATFAGSPLLSQYRTGDAFGSVLGVAIDSASDTTTFNVTHVQTG